MDGLLRDHVMKFYSRKLAAPNLHLSAVLFAMQIELTSTNPRYSGSFIPLVTVPLDKSLCRSKPPDTTTSPNHPHTDTTGTTPAPKGRQSF